MTKTRRKPVGTESARRRIALLGATGSIGRSTQDIVAAYPDRFQIVAAAAGKDARGLAELVARFHPRLVALYDPAAAAELRRVAGGGVEVLCGDEGLRACATYAEADVVVGAIAGVAGLAALTASKRVALANKESLVAGGPLVRSLLAQGQGEIIPVDSEHSALFQCLAGRPRDQEKPSTRRT